MKCGYEKLVGEGLCTVAAETEGRSSYIHQVNKIALSPPIIIWANKETEQCHWLSPHK